MPSIGAGHGMCPACQHPLATHMAVLDPDEPPAVAPCSACPGNTCTPAQRPPGSGPEQPMTHDLEALKRLEQAMTTTCPTCGHPTGSHGVDWGASAAPVTTCPECPDARCAPLPTETRYEELPAPAERWVPDPFALKPEDWVVVPRELVSEALAHYNQTDPAAPPTDGLKAALQRAAVPPELLHAGQPPVIDPDCRDRKCGSCAGWACEHECHAWAKLRTMFENDVNGAYTADDATVDELLDDLLSGVRAMLPALKGQRSVQTMADVPPELLNAGKSPDPCTFCGHRPDRHDSMPPGMESPGLMRCDDCPGGRCEDPRRADLLNAENRRMAADTEPLHAHPWGRMREGFRDCLLSPGPEDLDDAVDALEAVVRRYVVPCHHPEAAEQPMEVYEYWRGSERIMKGVPFEPAAEPAAEFTPRGPAKHLAEHMHDALVDAYNAHDSGDTEDEPPVRWKDETDREKSMWVKGAQKLLERLRAEGYTGAYPRLLLDSAAWWPLIDAIRGLISEPESPDSQEFLDAVCDKLREFAHTTSELAELERGVNALGRYMMETFTDTPRGGESITQAAKRTIERQRINTKGLEALLELWRLRYEPRRVTVPVPTLLPKPYLGQIVWYRGKQGRQALRAAVVTATTSTLDPDGVESGDVPALSSDHHAHLWVFTPAKQGPSAESGGFPEFDVPPCDSHSLDELEPGAWTFAQP